MTQKKKIGIIAGFHTPTAAALKAHVLAMGDENVEILTSETDFTTCEDPVFALSDRKIFVFNEAELLAEMGADLILVPDVVAAGFIKEVQTEIQTKLLTVPADIDGEITDDHLKALAEEALKACTCKLPKPFKLGLIGGLGPAATVDLYDKIVKATPAANDQEHFKVVIEQNPQIPDRTACLLDGGADPTLAMYNAAKRLQKDGCDAILIPCNTAHAFLPRLLRGLEVPFIDMQQTMLDEIQAKFGKDARVGLMATSGTVRSGIYSQKAQAMNMQMFTPDPEFQERVMAAIYGPKGAKAGYTDGVCYDDLYAAAEHLVTKYDCNVLILGCTELPLIFQECDDFACGGKTIAIVDPTATLARKAVEVAVKTNQERGTR